MLIVLSGEGPSDIGACVRGLGECTGNQFQPGPMTRLIDQVIEARLGYSPTDFDNYHFIGESRLSQAAAERRANKRKVSLTGKKRGDETGFHHTGAWMLGQLALDIANRKNDPATLAVLFRDCDGTRSTPNDEWQRKYDSMVSGFKRAGFEHGVPMLPRPKSEAWLLGIAQSHADFSALEELSGNDASPASAKKQLADLLGDTSAQALCEWLDEMQPDLDRLSTMPSFKHFRNRLHQMLDALR